MIEQTVHTGDCRELATLIPDHSVDLLFTDPPYLSKFLPLYKWLSHEAVRVLKPDGFLMVYSGDYHKNKIMHWLGEQLEYFWDFTAINRGNGPMNWQRRIICKAKSILCYRLFGSSALPRCNVLSAFYGTGQDKKWHVWQQDESTARYYIDCFSQNGDLVYDPFVGGGTTPYVCRLIGRRFIGMEIDPVQAEVARARVDGTRQLEFTAITQTRLEEL
jgi:DNA modification methylase